MRDAKPENAERTNAEIEAGYAKTGTPVAVPDAYVLRGDGRVVRREDREFTYGGEIRTL